MKSLTSLSLLVVSLSGCAIGDANQVLSTPLPEAADTANTAVALHRPEVLAVQAPCVADVQALGGRGFGWLALRTDGTVWKGSPAQNEPILGGDVVSISDVDGESLHHCAIKSDGTLWCWGNNVKGQCGTGDTVPDVSAPVMVSGLPSAVTYVAVSWDFTCALLDDSSVWCWGGNTYAQLGTGAPGEEVLAPVKVVGIPAAREISAGYDHVCIIDNADKLWCWGGNLYGQIGAGDFTPPAPPHPTPQVVMTNVRSISAGGFFNEAIDNNGQMWCWGDNTSGHCGYGLGDISNRAVPTIVPAMSDTAAVDTGVRSGCGLKNDGSVWCWGFQGSGRLGDGVYSTDDVTQREAPGRVSGFLGQAGGAKAIRVAEGTGCAIAMNDTLWCWGWGDFLDGSGPTAVPTEIDLCGLPSMSSLVPETGSTLGGTRVVINGDEFQTGAAVSFNSTAGTNVNVVSPSRIEVDAPVFWEAVVDVTVDNPDGTSAVLRDSFTFLRPPGVWQTEPDSGPTEGGVRVVVLGSAVSEGASVTFGGAEATDVVLVDEGLEVTIPAHAPGDVDVVVTNADGQSDTAVAAFEYTLPPTPDAIDVTVGPTAGGTRVVITGVGFDWTSTVSFGGVAAESSTYVDEQTMSAYTPAHDPGTVDIEVTNADGQTGVLSMGFTFDDDGGSGGGGGGSGGGGGGCNTGTGAPGRGSTLVVLAMGLLFSLLRKRHS